MSEWRNLMHAGEFEKAEGLMLEETNKNETGYETVTRAWFYENWGDSALDAAKRSECYEKSLNDYQIFASWATSGGEGTARMIDVKRLRKKIEDLKN